MKKSTKLVALLLALIMCLSLCACGSSTDEAAATTDTTTSSAESKSTDSSSAANAAQDKAEAAAEAALATDSTEEIAPVGDPIELTAATQYNPSAMNGIFFQYYMDKVTELSGGTITWDSYFSGTLGGAGEYMDMIKADSLDVCAAFGPSGAFTMPCFCVIQQHPGSVRETMEYYDYITYENETSAPIFQKEANAFGATYMGATWAAPRSYWLGTGTYESFTDYMAKCKIGVVSEAGYYYFGFDSAVVVDTTAQYENMRTGICDGCETNAGEALTNRLYEVAKFYIRNNLWSPNSFLMCNTNTLENKLSPEQKEVMYEAARQTEEYTIVYCEQLDADFEETLEAEGCTIISMTDEEFSEYYNIMEYQAWDDLMYGLGAACGMQDDIEPVLNIIMDYICERQGLERLDITECNARFQELRKDQ